VLLVLPVVRCLFRVAFPTFYSELQTQNFKTPELTYCGRFRRQIPSLPDVIDISSHPSKSNCYTGVASLIFENRRTRIPLLYTDDWYDIDLDAERHAARAASEIAAVLHLKPPPEPANG
jgi:hypothetical protein